MKTISVSLVLAGSVLATACGSDPNSAASPATTGLPASTSPAPNESIPAELPPASAGPPPTTVLEPVGSTRVELPPATFDAPGDAAIWTLESPDAVTASSETFTALVRRLACSGGVTGEVLEPIVEVSETDIIVTFFVASLDSDLEQTCPGNDEVPYELELGEPIGQRRVLDGSCRTGGEAASTSFCAPGATRWVP